MPRLVIVGGGITGLSAAYEMEKSSNWDITLLESADRLGGKIQTERLGDFLIESGPDSIFARKPWALDLIRELGLENDLIEPDKRSFSMLVNGCLHPVPSGLISLTFMDPEVVAEAPFLGDNAKAAVLNERNVPKGDGGDESIASFFRRRFGEEFSRLVAEPLLAGTHGGPAESLSMAALYPGYLDAEQKFGSLGATPKSQPSNGAHATFVSMHGGMQALVDGVARNLAKTCVQTNATVSRVGARSVTTSSGEQLRADAVLLAIPSFVAAELLASETLASIEHASSAVATLGFDASKSLELDGSGFLVPASEGAPITGCTWSSSKWSGRAPADSLLMRVFLSDRESATDGDLVTVAVDSVRNILGIDGQPTITRVKRWVRGLPQYRIGHLQTLGQIDREMSRWPGVYVAGTSYRGVGIPDCVRQGREAARRVLDS